MEQLKDVMRVFLSRLIGFIIFLVVLGIVNILTYYILNDTFKQVVLLLNANVFLIILFTIVLLIGEIFGVLMFPFNLPAPLFNAVGGVFLVRFLFNIFEFLDKVVVITIPYDLEYVYYIVAVIVFVIVVITGYIKIFSGMTGKGKKKSKEGRDKKK